MTKINQFNQIESKKLQTFNRIQMVKNLREIGKVDEAKKYLETLTNKDRAFLLTMVSDIHINGEEYVRAGIIRENNQTAVG